ncbi:MAG: hypothetical protein ACPG1C_08250 [Alphaproteobacteria bacterium]
MKNRSYIFACLIPFALATNQAFGKDILLGQRDFEGRLTAEVSVPLQRTIHDPHPIRLNFSGNLGNSNLAIASFDLRGTSPIHTTNSAVIHAADDGDISFNPFILGGIIIGVGILLASDEDDSQNGRAEPSTGENCVADSRGYCPSDGEG